MERYIKREILRDRDIRGGKRREKEIVRERVSFSGILIFRFGVFFLISCTLFKLSFDLFFCLFLFFRLYRVVF